MKFSMKLLMASLLLALSMNASTAFAPVSPSHTSKDLVALSASSDPKVVMPYGEGSRKYRRTFFTHKDWLRHRSEDRFSRTIFSTIRSGVVRQLAKEVGFITATAIFVVAWNLLTGGYSDLQGVHHGAILKNIANLELPIAPFTLSSPALGLLLVFKTNTAYGRWDESRKAWGLTVNHSRNLARMACAWVTEENEPDPVKRKAALDRMAVCIWAFPRSLQRHLLGEVEDGEDYIKAIRERCPSSMADGLIAARHKPSRALFELSNAIDELPMPYLRRIELDKSCVEYANAMGAMDRIFGSPVPLVYTRHTARFLGVWLLGMPLGLWSAFGNSWNHVGLIPASAIISFFFFGIEQISIELEEPFSVLPLVNMTEGMGLSAREFAEWHLELETYDPRTIGGRTVAVEEYVPEPVAPAMTYGATTNGAAANGNFTMSNWPSYPTR